MKNLAGNKDCDIEIRKELEAAGIEVVEVNTLRHEVPYKLIGKIGNWTLRRAWYYWMASVEDGKGLPKVVAEELNKRFYGEIRVGCMSGGDEVSRHLEEGYINNYHIDTQEGLNAFATLVAVLQLR